MDFTPVLSSFLYFLCVFSRVTLFKKSSPSSCVCFCFCLGLDAVLKWSRIFFCICNLTETKRTCFRHKSDIVFTHQPNVIQYLVFTLLLKKQIWSKALNGAKSRDCCVVSVWSGFLELWFQAADQRRGTEKVVSSLCWQAATDRSFQSRAGFQLHQSPEDLAFCFLLLLSFLYLPCSVLIL